MLSAVQVPGYLGPTLLFSPLAVVWVFGYRHASTILPCCLHHARFTSHIIFVVDTVWCLYDPYDHHCSVVTAFEKPLVCMDAHFWTQVESTCEALYADIYLPPDIESHLQRTVRPQDQPNSYTFQLRAALESAERLFHPDGNACQVENAFSALSTELETIEQRLVNLVSCLEKSSAAVRSSVDHHVELRSHAVATLDEARHISEFVQAIVLPEHIPGVVESSNPHSREFHVALERLSQAIYACNLHKDTLSVQQVHQSVLSLRDIAILRIDERFHKSLRLMRDPESSFMILRDTLLMKQRPLVDFVRLHELSCFETLTLEYVEIAKLAFNVHVRSHYRLLARCVSIHDVLSGGSFSMQERTSGMLSSIWDYAATISKLPDTGGALIREEIQQSNEIRNLTKEDIRRLSDQCAGVMRTSLSSPLNAAELRLKGNTLILPLSGLIREVAVWFLSYEKSESQFVSAVFDGNDHNFLADIFSDRDSPVLSCVEECIQNSDSRSEPEELCLSLYICRRIRESVVTRRNVDHRISVFLLIERSIQTKLLSALDLRARAAKELLLRRGSHEVSQTMVATGITQFSSLVSTLLVIAQQGDKWIHSQDVGYALRRRLYSCVSTVLAAEDKIEWADINSDNKFNAYVRCSTDVLSTLDICRSLDASQCGSEDLRRLLQDSFSHGCKSFSRFIANHFLSELDLLESSMSLLSVDDVAKHCSVLLDKLKETEVRVREGMKCLKNDKVDSLYENEAVKIVLTSLHHRTEVLKQNLSVHHSGLSAMLDW